MANNLKQSVNNNQMKKLTSIFLLVIAVVACSNESGSESTKDPVAMYLAVKDALVLTDAKATQKAAKAFLNINENTSLQEPLEVMAGSTNVAEQRAAFELLSENMYRFVKTTGAEITLYRQYCPMAFNNKGAYWLAKEKQVNNPYFGDRMLHCGSVREVLDK